MAHEMKIKISIKSVTGHRPCILPLSAKNIDWKTTPKNIANEFHIDFLYTPLRKHIIAYMKPPQKKTAAIVKYNRSIFEESQ